jgi:hypothetical protein
MGMGSRGGCHALGARCASRVRLPLSPGADAPQTASHSGLRRIRGAGSRRAPNRPRPQATARRVSRRHGDDPWRCRLRRAGRASDPDASPRGCRRGHEDTMRSEREGRPRRQVWLAPSAQDAGCAGAGQSPGDRRCSDRPRCCASKHDRACCFRGGAGAGARPRGAAGASGGVRARGRGSCAAACRREEATEDGAEPPARGAGMARGPSRGLERLRLRARSSARHPFQPVLVRRFPEASASSPAMTFAAAAFPALGAWSGAGLSMSVTAIIVPECIEGDEHA